MIEIDIPGFRRLALSHLVADYNGTLAVDGRLLAGVAAAFTELAGKIRIHVVTADTFGAAAAELAALPVELAIVPREAQAEAKLDFVNRLGADCVVAIGNGRNDHAMLRAAALGIAVVQKEGSAAQTLAAADVVCLDVLDALALLGNPGRLIATLRS
jgi:soluble P-type ATPase